MYTMYIIFYIYYIIIIFISVRILYTSYIHEEFTLETKVWYRIQHTSRIIQIVPYACMSFSFIRYLECFDCKWLFYSESSRIKINNKNWNNTHILSTYKNTPYTLQNYVCILHITSSVPLISCVVEFGNSKKTKSL